MTKLKRTKKCLTCSAVFTERYGDSHSQWSNRIYCSITCNNSSPTRVTSIFERLEKYQIKGDGCWSWSGAKDGNGYGILSNRKGRGFSPEKAYRVSYELFKGVIPEGLCVRHSCDNPECTNPDHLEVGTHKDNMQDKSKRGRINPISFKNLNRKKSLDDHQVREILSMKLAGKNGKGGVTKKELAEKYNVHPDTILNSIRRYKNVQ